MHPLLVAHPTHSLHRPTLLDAAVVSPPPAVALDTKTISVHRTHE